MKLEFICRVCLKEGELKSIYEAHKMEGDEKILCSKMFNECTKHKVEPNDGFPSQICKSCFSKLWSSYKFHRLCETSYDTLSNYILTNKYDIKAEVSDDCPLIDFVKLNGTIEIVQKVEESSIKEEELPFGDNKDDSIYQDDFQTDDFDDNNATKSENEDKPQITDTNDKVERKKKKLKLKNDSKEKSEKSISCEFCDKMFKSHLSYLKHKDKHLSLDKELSSSGEKSFSCSRCPAEFYNQEILSEHEKTHGNRKKQSSCRKEVPCPHCSKTFKNKLCLEKHINNHLGITIPSDGVSTCRYCPKTFKDKMLLTKHEAGHLGLKPYFCERCNKSYRSEVDHRAYCDITTWDFQCSSCPKRFKTKARLISHIVIHDTNRKWYCCDHEGCKRTFKSQPGLAKHKLLHTGIKIMCHLCSKEFTDKYLLQMHVNRHNNERKHPCSYCEKRFFSSGARLEHERRHTNTRNFACQQCDKRFVSSTNLKRHMLWHEKSFNEQCRFCEKKFLVRGNRMTHEAIMHGITRTVDESKYFCQQRFKATRLPKVVVDTTS